MKFKRFVPVFLSVVLAACFCFGLAGCGEKVSLHGDPAPYTNKAGSVSIDLPANGEDSWIENEVARDDLLDVTHNRGTINVQLLCLSKKTTDHVAKDLDGFRKYVLAHIFTDFADNKGNVAKATDVTMPEFAKDGKAWEYSYTADGQAIKGYFVVMESDECFEACLITPTEETFTANQDKIKAMIASIKEL